MTKLFFKGSGMKPLRMAVALAVVIGLLVGSAMFNRARGQSGQRGGGTTITPPQPVMRNVDPLDMPPVYEGDPMRARAEQRRLQYMNLERQKAMVADTNRLVKLAADLNGKVNGEQHAQLSPDQVRELAEIEKLAHSVREKMSTSVKQMVPYQPPPVFMPPQ